LLIFRKQFSQEKLEKYLKNHESYFQKLHKQDPTGRANLFTGIFGIQEWLILIITSRIKLEILGHVVQSFSRKRLNFHQIHRLFYKQDESVWCLSTKKRG